MVNASVAGSAAVSVAVGVGVGGTGGLGGDGGEVDATYAGNVTTAGDNAGAWTAQSVGGGGGQGGFNVTGVIAGGAGGSGGVAVGVGGSGGGGGDGGLTTGNLTGDITTTGNVSGGVLLQSAGGGGGSGGINISGNISGGTAAVPISVGFGGAGGGGGDGGVADLTYSGTATTSGLYSNAVVAQSVGGGGGQGALNVSGGIAGSAGGGAGIMVGVGGAGGGGGNADQVTGHVTGIIGTEGGRSDAVVIQSTGGGGGGGGVNVSGAIDVSTGGSGSAAVGFGGAGGDGGNGGVVDATVLADVTTRGSESRAVFAQSLGGGGGSGGINVSGSLNLASAGAAVGVGFGGSGGGGGTASTADLTYSGTASTAGDDSTAIMVQSLGGGGGRGALNVSGGLSGTAGGGGAIMVGFGGSGGGGGNADLVTSHVSGNIGTAGARSDAVSIQSLGGGGGQGGINVSGGAAISGAGSGNVSVGFGGAGGDGGNAGAVDATVLADVATSGAEARGVFAQSLGGGGGKGGINVSGGLSASSAGSGSASVGFGGSGGGGGDGATVDLVYAGLATTTGDDAAAVVAQSVGGGGGKGALNVSGGLGGSSAGGAAVMIGVGGSGGGGGNAGIATNTVEGTITTHGLRSDGVFTQSLGGGGGDGGINVSGGVALSSAGSANVSFGVGGAGGDGGSAEAVIATIIGNVTTLGDESRGVFTQSAGGGGGNGALNVAGGLSASSAGSGGLSIGIGGFGGGGGNGQAATLTLTGDVTTSGAEADAVLVQSNGGGGGKGGMNIAGNASLSSAGSGAVAIGVGGFGGAGGSAGEATLNLTGNTITSGINTDAVTVQSVGGGGGKGGINISGSLGIAFGGGAGGASLGLGGFGGGGGAGGNVVATIMGDVLATGYAGERVEHDEDGILRRYRDSGSNGIIAQSVGGSGGHGGMNISGGIQGGTTSGVFNLGVGGFGGDGGNAGTVDLNATGNLFSAVGDERTAVSAQSIGGSGGNGALNISGGITGNGQLTVGVGGFGGAGGTAEKVTATVDGNISALGTGARGFMAQSVGGGGGNGGVNISGGVNALSTATAPSLIFGLGGFGGAGNMAGEVEATQNGAVVVGGRDSIGVLAQSVGGGGGSGRLNITGGLAAGKGLVGTVGIGGKGGAGADADNVTLNSDGYVYVDARTLDENDEPPPTDPAETDFADRGNGILVQSIGGGGGSGGVNISGVIAPIGHVLSAGVGGTGGGGGNAGTVNVTRGANTAALLETTGNQSNGLTAQSVGGGGGDAGMNFVTSVNGLGSASTTFESNIVIGGGGGDPGHGNTTTVDHTGNITTSGHQSNGLLAQSVGGGGGNAAISLGLAFNKGASGVNLAVGGGPGDGGRGEQVDVTHSGVISTQGHDSMGIFAQSVGGGGGNSALTMAVALLASNKLDIGIGRYGGTGGVGGNVLVNSAGELHTQGDRSVGLLAQSVGNGGGRSGSMMIAAKGSSTDGETSSSASGGLSVGLEGGVGGRAGTVDVDTSTIITTQGKEAHAIHAQSVGGGGGIGGSATNLIIRESAAGRVGVGGTGGSGGIGDLVDVLNSGSLTTHGDDAHGIYAQSIGGGGGTGGMSGVLALQIGGDAGGGNNTFGLSVGGTGGTGADGGGSQVTNQGVITTHGEASHGIKAQSVGGGGGDGGMVVNGSLSGAGRGVAATVGLGGFGGTGGDGGLVVVDNSNQITTGQAKSSGIFAQSIGGGGGNAGLVGSFDISKSASDASSALVAVNIGREGGTGGDGGRVDVTNRDAGQIVTQGDLAYGVFAQSIGGGGGNGSSVVSANFGAGGSSADTASLSFGLNVGGTGGIGGVGGNVTLNNLGLVDTSGAGAHGVFAQSVGGGGGNGGLALAGNALYKPADGGALAVALGGGGGDGGDASAVTVSNYGQIVTRGANAHGILAQSVGGGGGNANVGLGASNPLVVSLVSNVISGLIGASGSISGDGGMGSTVVVNHTGDITVMGAGSQTIKAESINGGGGGLILDFNGITSLPGGEGLPGVPDGTDPGISVDPLLTLRAGGDDQINMAAGAVTINNTGTFGAAGNNSVGLGLQSVGGGGGSLLLDLEFAPSESDASGSGQFAKLQGGGSLGLDTQLGGTGGQDNHGNVIDSTHSGDIITNGKHSPAASLLSIGGGGGRAVLAIDGDASGLGSVNLIMGANGGTNNGGGDIIHQQQGNLVSTGDNAAGFLAQSIGAGGGELHVSGVNNFAITLGGQNAANGDGGSIEFAHTGNVQTIGTRSHAVFLQSIGGGGGAVFNNAQDLLPATLSADNSGNGGAISVELDGDIVANGASAYGLFAQSLGGGGGYVDGLGALLAGGQGSGGQLNIDLNGNVVSHSASAVYLQSEGGDGAGDITLNLAAERIIHGGINTAALVFAGGDNNRFTNRGILSSRDGETGLAMLGTSGDDFIDNFGIIQGGLELGTGVNTLTNHGGAQVLSGSTINLGAPGNLFSNQGMLAPGGSGHSLHSQLNGSYVQSTNSLAVMEMDFATGTMDGLFATGTASVAGNVDVELLNVHRIRSGAYSKTLFSGDQGLTDNGLNLNTNPSVVINYQLGQLTQNDVSLNFDVDFAAHNQLGNNLSAVGNYFNRVQDAGSSTSLADLVSTLVGTGDIADYRNVLNQLSPTFYAAQQSSSIRTAQQFGRSLMSCESQDGRYRYKRQGSCMWLRMDLPSTHFDAHGDMPAMDYSGTRTALGGQKTEGNWTLGAGFSVEDFNSEGFNNYWKGRGETQQLGGVAKYQLDNVLLTSSLVTGRSDTSMRRAMTILNPEIAASRQELSFTAITFGFTQQFQTSYLTVRPLFEVGALRMSAQSESEAGVGALGLQLESSTDSHTWFRPGVELGHEFEFRSGASLRPYTRASLVHYLHGEDSEVRAGLVGAPASVEGMRVTNALGQNQRLIEAGLDYMALDGFSVQLRWERTLAKHVETEQAIVKVIYPF
ncbi:MAG: autotransporter outer membrane beta-barrel domain-containing protein [Cellvibrionaceae bacterium]